MHFLGINDLESQLLEDWKGKESWYTENKRFGIMISEKTDGSSSPLEF